MEIEFNGKKHKLEKGATPIDVAKAMNVDLKNVLVARVNGYLFFFFLFVSYYHDVGYAFQLSLPYPVIQCVVAEIRIRAYPGSFEGFQNFLRISFVSFGYVYYPDLRRRQP